MIYIITDNPDKFPPNPIYRMGSREDVISYIKSALEISIDAETRGFNPYTKKLLSLQIGDLYNQYIIDCESMSIGWLKTPLESKVLTGQNCLPSSTEVLTINGWINIKHICLSDTIYGYEEGNIKKQNINGIVKTRDIILNLHGKSRSLRSTPNHRWLFQENNSKHVIYKTTEDIIKLKKGKIILNGKYINTNTKTVLSDDELRLFTWAITDGHISFGSKGQAGQTVITQSLVKSKFVKEIDDIITRLSFIIYKKRTIPMKGYSDCKRWVISAVSIRTILDKIKYTKNFNYCQFVLSLNSKQLEIFIETFNNAEGCESCEGDYTIGQSKAKNPTKRDAIALALYLKGYTVGFTKDVVSSKITTFMDIRNTQAVYEPIQDVYCLNTGLSNFVIRQNEQIFLTGNCKFDLKFLYHQGIYPRKIYDTFVVERVLNCGLDMVLANLDALTERYLKVRLDKSVRVDIPREGLTPRVISYAADDIKYLPQIKELQLKAAEEQDLLQVVKLENMFTPCLAYIEYCGFKLNPDKWKAKMFRDQENLVILEKQLNDYILERNMQQHIEQQIDMFRERGCTINWSSPKQTIEFFESQGIDCSIVIKGVKKKSVEEAVLKKYENTHEIVKMYLDFKKAEKLTTTYGENFIQQIDPVTNRVHTNFKQVLDTGRTSSGGKDRDRGINLINFQNIPKDYYTRACFEAEEGSTLIIADYSGQEQIVLANMSLDLGLLEFYDKGMSDMHSFVAAKMYPEINTLPIEEIKAKHKDKRQSAKAVGFSINYGGAGTTIANNMGCTKEEGDKIYNAYFEAFPGLKIYFDKAKQQGLNDGHILISPITRRKSYLYYYDKYVELANKMDQKYWIKYRAEKEKDSEEFYFMKRDVREYFSYKGQIERKALNYPIQGQSAEIVKIATIFIYHWILDNNWFGIVKICNTIHDELVLECPINMAKDVAEKVKEFMVRAGRFYCKRVPLTVEPDINFFWRK